MRLARPSLTLWAGRAKGTRRNNSSRLESARKASELEGLLAEAPDSWRANPQMAESLGKARDFLVREKEFKQTFDQKLAGLQHIAAAGFRGALAQAGPDRASCDHALSRLAPEYQSAGKSALGAWDAQWQTFRNAELGGILARAEEAAVALNATNGVEPVRAALPASKRCCRALRRCRRSRRRWSISWWTGLAV